MGTVFGREVERSPPSGTVANTSGTIANTYRSNVELHSKALPGVPSPVSTSARHNNLQYYVKVFPKLFLFKWLHLKCED